MTEPRTAALNLSIALDPEFARTMTDEEAQQIGVILKDRARTELELPRLGTEDLEALIQARFAADTGERFDLRDVAAELGVDLDAPAE